MCSAVDSVPRMCPIAVVTECFLQAILDLALVLGAFHVNEVDHDQAAQVAQAQLARDLLGRFEIGVERRRLDVARFGRSRRIDVDRHQRFRVVDHDCAARRQRHLTRVRGLDLMFDLES